MQMPGCRFTWSPRLLLLELFAFVMFRLWLLPLPLLFFSSCACLVSSETAASRMLTVALAPDSERMFAFGLSFCSVSGSAPSSLVTSWCGSLGARLPFVPCLFLWSRYHSRVNGRGAGEVLPIGLFPLSAFGVALPPLWRWQTREAESCGPIRSLGRLPGVCSSLSSSPLPLPGVVMTFPVCLPRAPALRQVLVAMLAEGTLESPSVLVLAFHSSLFLVEGSSDGSAPGDRFLSPGRSSFGFSASSFARSLRDGVTLPGRVCLSPRSERRLFLHLPGVWLESSRWGHPVVSGLSQISIGTKTFCAPSLVVGV